MTIRYRLLLSYIFTSLTSIILITLLFFHHFSSVLTDEIENDLKLEALSMMHEIDWYLFERMQNISIWRNINVMQDIKVNDIDKRIAMFLNDISQGYQGVYPFLLAADKDGNIVADSDILGQHKKVAFKKDAMRAINIVPPLVYFQADTSNHDYFSLLTPIMDQFNHGVLGYLYTAVNWNNIFRILDSPLPFEQLSSHSFAFLIDKNDRIIAASKQFRQNKPDFSRLPENWGVTKTAQGVQQTNSTFAGINNWVITWAASNKQGTSGKLGWRVVIMTPLHHAYEPVSGMWQILLTFCIFTTLLAAAVAFGVSRHIAQPIILLAKFTQDYMANQQTHPPEIPANGEITLLSEQFNQLITNLEQSQQERIRITKLAVIAEMAATMAHEIRTPLGILLSSSQMLSREKNLSPVAQEMIGYIASETTRLNHLVTSLLETSKPCPPKFKLAAFTPVIEHAIDLLSIKAEKKSVVITLLNNQVKDEILYDKDQMLQVFLNLLMNAIQHLPDDGRIQILMQSDSHSLTITVSDDGSGIADAQKESVFEPFFTRRKEGFGLGLTVVQQIINSHHGKITLSDSLWGGACFTIQLPRKHQNPS